MQEDEDIEEMQKRLNKEAEIRNAFMFCFVLMFGLFCAGYFDHDSNEIWGLGVIALVTAIYIWKKIL